MYDIICHPRGAYDGQYIFVYNYLLLIMYWKFYYQMRVKLRDTVFEFELSQTFEFRLPQAFEFELSRNALRGRRPNSGIGYFREPVV